MIKIRLINDEEVYDLLKYDYEDELATVCNLLSNQYDIQILKRLEGPGTTVWRLKINGNAVSLVNNSYGNFFKPESDNAKNFFRQEREKISTLLS